MPAPHRTFFYVFEDYKQNIFREWWQKEERRELERGEKILLRLFIGSGIVTMATYCVTCVFWPKNTWVACILAALMVALGVIIMIHTNHRNCSTLDEEAEKYYMRWIKRLYDRLHDQDYDNQISLAWIIQKCQEIVDQGTGLERALNRFKQFFVAGILPILSFCYSAISHEMSPGRQFAIGMLGVCLLIYIFAMVEMIRPGISTLASKRVRVAKELKEGAEYLLAQGDLEISEKPRAALKREAFNVAG